MAEHRIARLRRLVETIERDLLRERVAQAKAWNLGPRDKDVIDLLETERDATEARLREAVGATVQGRPVNT